MRMSSLFKGSTYIYGYKLRCIFCCAVLSCLCLFGGCSREKPVSVVSEEVVLPYGTEINPDGTIVLPYGTEVNDDGAIVLPFGAEISDDGAVVLPSDNDGNAVGTAAQPDAVEDVINGAAEGTDSGSYGIITEQTEAEQTAAPNYASADISESVADVLGFAAATNSLPAVFIFTDDGKGITSREEYQSCTVYTVNDPSGTPIASASAGVRLRGNSTAEYGDLNKVLKQQVPYRIKFDKKTNMMGLNDGVRRKNWVLLKYDWGGTNDRIVFELSKVFLHGYLYSTDTIVVRGYVNGEYKGLYLLCEQNQTGKGRVEVNEPEEGYQGTDIGYFVELDNYCESPCVKVDYAGCAQFTDLEGNTRNFADAMYSIKSDIYSDAQEEFIKKYLNNVFYIVYEACVHGKYYGLDKNAELIELTGTHTAEEVCERVLDIDSVVDMYLVHETGCSSDCGEGSFYMCVDFSGESRFDRLTFTAPWDFNWPSGCDCNEYWAAVFRSNDFIRSFGDRSNPWFILLMKQDWFAARVAERWAEVREAAYFTLESEKGMLDEYASDMDKCDRGTATGNAYYWLDHIRQRLGWFDEEFAVKTGLEG